MSYIDSDSENSCELFLLNIYVNTYLVAFIYLFVDCLFSEVLFWLGKNIGQEFRKHKKKCFVLPPFIQNFVPLLKNSCNKTVIVIMFAACKYLE